MFPWPHKYEIWLQYLTMVVKRFRDTKVERVRDLFQKCLRSLPESGKLQKKGRVKDEGKIFYIIYADFEEKYGLASHAMKIYDRALKDITDQDVKFQIFNLYLAKTAKHYGVTHSRQLFERSFQMLDGKYLIQIGLRFAKMERKLGEIERARNIYEHLS